VYKQRLSEAGMPIYNVEKHDVGATVPSNATNSTCGSCYGSEDAEFKCCNTCDDVGGRGQAQRPACLPLPMQRQAAAWLPPRKLHEGLLRRVHPDQVPLPWC
jgi:hypothetical protein